MLPSTSVQTGGSLWGMERLPLYDAAVRTNHDLVQAAADCEYPGIPMFFVKFILSAKGIW